MRADHSSIAFPTACDILAAHRYPRDRGGGESRRIKAVARDLKHAEARAVRAAVRELLPRLRSLPHAVLVPVPCARGGTDANAVLAHALAIATGATVLDLLAGAARDSQHLVKRAGCKPLTAADLLMRGCARPRWAAGWPVYLVDNVMDTGATLAAACAALGVEARAIVWARTSR